MTSVIVSPADAVHRSAPRSAVAKNAKSRLASTPVMCLVAIVLMLCSACVSHPVDHYSNALRTFSNLLAQNQFELVVPPRADRAPGCVLDNNDSSAIVTARIPVVTAPPAPAAFLKQWSDTDRTQADLDLFSLLPGGEQLRAAFSSQGVSSYTMTFTDAYVLATTIDDIELGLRSLPSDRRKSASRGTRIIVESLYINEVSIGGDWNHKSSSTIDVGALASAVKGELTIKEAGEGGFNVSVQTPVAVGMRTRPVPPPDGPEFREVELDFERTQLRFEVAVKEVSKEVTYCTKLMPYLLLNEARADLSESAFDLQSSQTEGTQLPTWLHSVALSDLRGATRIHFKVDAHEETHCNPKNSRPMEAAAFGSILADSNDIVDAWIKACNELPSDRWQDDVVLKTEPFRCELYFSRTDTASTEKSRAWVTGSIRCTLVPRIRRAFEVRAVHVPARGDVGALVYRDMRYWDRSTQSQRAAPANDSDLIATAISSVGVLTIPKGMDAYLVGYQLNRWQESLTAGIDERLMVSELPLDLGAVCRKYQELKDRRLEWLLYLRQYWHQQLVAIDLAEDDLAPIPRFASESERLTGQIMTWADECLAPVLNDLITSKIGYIVMIGPRFFETTECAALNTMVWPKMLLAQNRSLLQRFPPADLALSGGRISTVPSRLWPAPNLPSTCMLWARVLQSQDLEAPILSDCTMLGVESESSKVPGLHDSDSRVILGMNDPIPRDNGDGFARLTFELRPK